MKAAVQTEVMEPRQLLAASGLFIPATGELNLQLGSQDNVRVSSVGGNLLVETSTGAGTYSPVLSLGVVSSASVQSLVVVGGDDANTIDLNGVTAAAFTSLTAISIDAANGHDTIIGSPDLGDSILGGHGHDTITGQGGNDTLVGGDGNDSIIAGDGDDSIRGGDGQDSITGDAGNDSVDSGDGDDTVSGGADNDNISADNGEDSLNGDAGDDTINGDGGIDTISGDDGNDSILGGEFADSLSGGIGNDTINGQAGNDNVDGGDGNDSLVGGAGNDAIVGGLGNDAINGESGADEIAGGDGNDSILGGGGNDSINGDLGDDTVRGQAGNDTLLGGGGADVVDGGAGNDVLGSVTLAAGVSGLSVTDVNTTEANAVIVVTISLSQPTTLPVSVQVNTSDNIAQAGIDYVAVNTLVTIPAGQISATISIPVLTDAIYEADETFFVDLSGAVNANIGDSQAIVTLANDDAIAATQVVFVDFDSQTSGTDHVYTPAERTMIMTRLGEIYAAFPVTFTTTQPVGGQFNTIFVNQPPPGGLASEIDFRNLNLTANATVDINGFLGNPGDPPATSQNFAELTTKVIAHENGHLLGLRHGDSFGPIGSGINFVPGPNAYGPAYPGPVSAFETTRHIMASPASVGETLFDAVSGQFFGEREAVKLSTWAFGGAVVAEQVGAHDTLLTAQPIQFRELFVPNTVVSGVNQGRAFRVNQLTVTGALNASGERDLYQFQGTAGQLMNFEVISSVLSRYTSTIDPIIRILDANGIPVPYYGTIARNDDEFESTDSILIDLTLPTTGAYFVEITPFSTGDTGSYELFGYDFASYLPSTGAGGGQSTLPADAGDLLLGGDGDDTVQGAEGNDTLSGQAGNDVLLGGAGNDSLLGGAGEDTLDGQVGDDTLDGQGGSDTVFGGLGDDTFIFTPGGSGVETINGGDGLNTALVNGTNLADTITIGMTGGALTISAGASTLIVNGQVQNIVVDGRAGDDSITVGDVSGTGFFKLDVRGGDGNDTLTAAGATIGTVRLSLSGDAGNDTLVGSNGNDTLDGGAGNDAANGGDGNDTILGGTGNDQIGGGLGNDVINGGDGNDFANGDAGNDRVTGGVGNDSLKGGDGADTLDGQAGDDNLNGMAGDDSLLGGVGRDVLAGGAGNDTLDGGRNDDTISGNSGHDLIRGDHGNDFIDAGDGNNTINAGDGHDTVLAADGIDLINGGDGNDQINAGNGNDIISGGDGNDSMQGGGGADVILGGDGDDYIDGQGGNDTVAGNQGIDVIVDPTSEINEQFVLSAAVLLALQAN